MIWTDSDERLNDLFMSKEPADVARFYSNFKTAEDLFAWSKRRPRGRFKIYTVNGKKDVVIVIPTANFRGEYAEYCRRVMFPGQQIVFVESGGRDDPYFNYATNSNIGLRYALRYKPRWIILANDDIFKIDNFKKLKKRLIKLDENKYETVYIRPDPDFYHSNMIGVTKIARLTKILKSFLYKNEYSRMSERLKLSVIENFKLNYQISSLERYPYKNRFVHVIYKLLYRARYSWRNFGDFMVFSPYVISRNKPLFDEIYINGTEDYDLSKRFFDGGKWTIVNFRVGSIGGGTMRKDLKEVSNKTPTGGVQLNQKRAAARLLQDVFNIIYSNYKINTGKFGAK